MGIDMAVEGDSLLLLSLVPSHCHMASASRSGPNFSKSLKIVYVSVSVCMSVCVCVPLCVYVCGCMVYAYCGREERMVIFICELLTFCFPVEN